MRAHEPKVIIAEYIRKYRAEKQPKTYLEYVQSSDYSPSRKKYIKDYYNYCINFYNLREQREHFDNELINI